MGNTICSCNDNKNINKIDADLVIIINKELNWKVKITSL